MGLYDMMMIKDNHVTAAGGLTQAVQRAEEYIQQQVRVHTQNGEDYRTEATGETIHTPEGKNTYMSHS
jgi:nicotinate-nucleotide pyrophosphorylase (carboxylating)